MVAMCSWVWPAHDSGMISRGWWGLILWMGTVMDIHVTEVKKQEHECYCIPVGDPGGLGADH